MNRTLLTSILGLAAFSASAQSFNEWLDPEVNAVNRGSDACCQFRFPKR